LTNYKACPLIFIQWPKAFELDFFTACGEIVVEQLFVYGTLGPGRPNEHILADIGGAWLKATVNGTLLQKGWGAEMGYPGIVLDMNGDKVEGFVFSSENLASHWPRLDEFEGEAYERVFTRVRLNDGNLVDAYVYVLKNA